MDRPRNLRRRVASFGAVLIAAGVASAAVAQDAPSGLRERAGELVERLEKLEPPSLDTLLARAATVDSLPAGVPYLARFPGPLPGLHVGAPVLAQGIRIGTVRDVVVAFATGATEVTASVTITLDIVPDRVVLDGARLTSDEALRAAVEALAARGLRARVAGAGTRFDEARIELVLDPQAPPPPASVPGAAPELPTLPPEPDRLRIELDRLLGRLAALPVEQMGADLAATLETLRELATAPELRTALVSLAAAADRLPDLVARLEPEATLWSDLRALLREVDGATRALRLLLEYLERHPDALIRGRGGATP